MYLSCHDFLAQHTFSLQQSFRFSSSNLSDGLLFSIDFIILIMNTSNLNADQVAQIQALLTSWSNSSVNPPASTPSLAAAGLGVSMPPSSASQQPITTTYQSPRAGLGLGLPGPPSSGHPSLPLPSSSTPGPYSQPFSGHNFSALRPHAVSTANQERLARAAENIPRRPSLPRRTRGRAIPPPVLPEAQPAARVENCIFKDGDVTKVRMTFKVYPDQVCTYYFDWT